MAVLLLIVAFASGRLATERSASPARVGLNRMVGAERDRLSALSGELTRLDARLDRLERLERSGRAGRSAGMEGRLVAARRAMGLVPAAGPGVAISLNDAPDASTVEGDPNDYVVHSEDVQAVANGLWAAGAEAVSVNGQRVTATSALLCVGNTLLVNGTVHSPPYRFLAVGGGPALEGRFLADPLVARVIDTFGRYGLVFSVERLEDTTVPAFEVAPARRHAVRGPAEGGEGN